VFRLLYKNTGGLAIGVPGELSGYYAAWQRFGRVPWPDLVNPTVELCEKGFYVEKALASAIRLMKTIIKNDTNFAYAHLSHLLINILYSLRSRHEKCFVLFCIGTGDFWGKTATMAHEKRS